LNSGKPLDLNDILHRVNIRKPKLVQQLGKQQVQHMVQGILSVNNLEMNGNNIVGRL